MTAPPLAGRRVLVTRAIEDSGIWATSLIALGAEAVILPCIHTELFYDDETQRRLVSALTDADWLCITSARGADAVAGLTTHLTGQLTPPRATEIRIAAVGGATAAAVRKGLGQTPFVARGGTSRALGEELLGELGAAAGASRVVVAAAEGGRTDVEEVLVAGGATVTRVDVYRTVPAAKNTVPLSFAVENITDVLLASPSAVQGLLNQTTFSLNPRVYTIGPTTSAAAIAAGLTVTGEAVHPTFDSLVEAMQ